MAISAWHDNGSPEVFSRFLATRVAPGAPPGPPKWPQEAQNEPQEAQHEPQEAPNDPKEGQNEPQAGQSELREVPGGFRERFCEDFRGIYKQRDATETLPPQTARRGPRGGPGVGGGRPGGAGARPAILNSWISLFL